MRKVTPFIVFWYFVIAAKKTNNFRKIFRRFYLPFATWMCVFWALLGSNQVLFVNYDEIGNEVWLKANGLSSELRPITIISNLFQINFWMKKRSCVLFHRTMKIQHFFFKQSLRVNTIHRYGIGIEQPTVRQLYLLISGWIVHHQFDHYTD